MRSNLKTISALLDSYSHGTTAQGRSGSLRRQWMLSFFGTTLLVTTCVTLAAWWYADWETRFVVEERLRSIGRSVAEPNYPMTPPVLRAVADLTDTQLILLDGQGDLVDATIQIPAQLKPKTPIKDLSSSELLDLRPKSGIHIDHDYRGPNGVSYHAGWLRFAGAESPGRMQPAAWVGILIDQATVRQMRWQALLLPMITGLATAIGLGTIAGWLTDRVVRRLQTVQRRVQRIAAGDYSTNELITADHAAASSSSHSSVLGSSGQFDELDELTANVNQMADELRLMEARIHATERERLVHALAAGLSHDLRNTLTGARLAIQLHAKQCTDDTESIAVAMRQLRLAEDQLMRWLRLGGESEAAESMPLKEILDKALELVQPMSEHLRSQLLTARASELESKVFQRCELLTSAILNLLLNAIQAAGQGGRVDLATAVTEAAWLAIEISDNGPGPTADVQARMFSPLVTTKREGVGLGLALVAKAARELAGEISWRREGDRTVFSLRLPLAEPSPL